MTVLFSDLHPVLFRSTYFRSLKCQPPLLEYPKNIPQPRRAPPTFTVLPSSASRPPGSPVSPRPCWTPLPPKPSPPRTAPPPLPPPRLPADPIGAPSALGRQRNARQTQKKKILGARLSWRLTHAVSGAVPQQWGAGNQQEEPADPRRIGSSRKCTDPSRKASRKAASRKAHPSSTSCGQVLGWMGGGR